MEWARRSTAVPLLQPAFPPMPAVCCAWRHDQTRHSTSSSVRQFHTGPADVIRAKPRRCLCRCSTPVVSSFSCRTNPTTENQNLYHRSTEETQRKNKDV